MYDHCAYVRRVEESTGPLDYMLNPLAHSRCDKCRVEFGLLAGPQVSHKADSQLVDVESDLMGRTRPLTRCPEERYQPLCAQPGGSCTTDTGIPYDCAPCRPALTHLRSCGPAPVRPTFAAPKLPKSVCGAPTSAAAPASYVPMEDPSTLSHTSFEDIAPGPAATYYQ